MALKSYRLLKGKKKKKKRRSGTRDIITGGVTAVIGLGLLGATTSAVNRI